jgi:hypothetical protein
VNGLHSRGRRKKSFPELTPGDAHAILRWLYALGKVTAREIRTAMDERDSLVAEITGRLDDPDALLPIWPRHFLES